MIHQLYHVGQHGDADNSFAPNWSPSGLPSYHDADGSHADDRGRDRGADRGVRRGGRPGAGERLRRHRGLRRVPRAGRPVLDAVVEPPNGRVGRHVREPDALLVRDPAPDPRALRRGLHRRARGQRGPGVRGVPVDRRARGDRRLARRAPADGLRHVRDRLVLRLLRDHPDLALRRSGSASRSPRRSRRSSGTPLVQAESHIRTPDAAEAVLAAGHADMVSIVRGQIADPHLVAKARAGRADEVRPCISCNQLCWGRRSRDYWISCLVNPSAGREWEWGGDRFEPAGDPRRVLVVGGGPAGLEAARVAAERGHRVTLLERGAQLGGQFRLAGLQPSRGQILDLLAWYGAQPRGARRRGPARRRRPRPTRSPRRRRRGDRGDRFASGPRTGSSGRCRWSTGCPAWTAADVFSIHDVLDGIGRRRVVASSSSTTSTTGAASGPPLHLAEPGHEVTIVTAAAVVARRASSTARPTARCAAASPRPAAGRSPSTAVSAGAPARRPSARR